MMAGGLLFTATLSAIFATLVCYWLGQRKASVVIPAQFFFAFIVTSLLSIFFSRDAAIMESLGACLLASAAFPLFFLLFRILFGPLDSRRPGVAGVEPKEPSRRPPPEDRDPTTPPWRHSDDIPKRKAR